MQISLPSAFLAFPILFNQPCGICAFSPSLRRSPSSTRLFFENLHSDVSDDSLDTEAARKQLEGLLTITAHPFRDEEDFPSSGWHSSVLAFVCMDDSSSLELNDDGTHAPPSSEVVDIELPPAPILTTLERERRSLEINLLKGLSQGDQSIVDLSHLWVHERGSNAAARLLKIEQLIAEGSEQWEKAERELRALIRDYDIYWVEPIHRLAMLLILQKRFLEAENMLFIVLAVKPWHMGALSGIVLVYAGLQDNPRATEWAARRLPKTIGGSRRSSWSRTAVQLAQDSLFTAEEHLKDMFGARDTHHSILRWRGVFVPDDGMSFWQ